MAAKQFDETDLEILRTLQSDGRITNADLAKHVGLSAPSVLQRVRALETAGLIRGYVALLDAERLGRKLTVWMHISLTLNESEPIEQFRAEVSEVAEVVEVYNITGEYDFLLKVLARDMKHYDKIVREKITKIRGVGKLNSSFVLGVKKHTTQIPI